MIDESEIKDSLFHKIQITSSSTQFMDTDLLIHIITKNIIDIENDEKYFNPRGFHIYHNKEMILYLCFYSTIKQLEAA